MGHQISQGSFCPPLPSFVNAEEDKGLYLVTFVTPYGGHPSVVELAGLGA